MAGVKPLNNGGAEGINEGRPESPLEKVAQTGKSPCKPIAIGYHPTDAEPQMSWEGKTGRINIGGGAGVPGGYSIVLNPEGENSVEFYRD
jgi:hypothetical protein